MEHKNTFWFNDKCRLSVNTPTELSSSQLLKWDHTAEKKETASVCSRDFFILKQVDSIILKRFFPSDGFTSKGELKALQQCWTGLMAFLPFYSIL